MLKSYLSTINYQELLNTAWRDAKKKKTKHNDLYRLVLGLTVQNLKKEYSMLEKVKYVYKFYFDKFINKIKKCQKTNFMVTEDLVK